VGVCVCVRVDDVLMFLSMHSVALSLFSNRARTAHLRKLQKLRTKGIKTASAAAEDERFPDDSTPAKLSVFAAALDVTARNVDAGIELSEISVQSLPMRSKDTVRSLTACSQSMSIHWQALLDVLTEFSFFPSVARQTAAPALRLIMITFEPSRILSTSTQIVLRTATGDCEKIAVLAAIWRSSDGSYAVRTFQAPSPDDSTLEVILAERKSSAINETEPQSRTEGTAPGSALCEFGQVRFF
jgi:hypothetical protein